MASPESKKSNWEKADILIKGLLPIAVAAVGYWGTSYLARQQQIQAAYIAERQQAEARAQFYTQLLTKREEADSSLRKEVFKYVIDKILGPTENNLDNQVLGLELLAYNFHDSIALGPLFKALYNKTQQKAHKRQDLIDRLERVSREITDRQIAALADPAHIFPASIDSFEDMKQPGFGSVLILDREVPAPEGNTGASYQRLKLQLEALSVDEDRKTAKVRLQVLGLDPVRAVVDATFSVSHFDFPMLDNTKFPDRQRLAVVLNSFGDDSAELKVVLFPEARASLKEKPYIDDLIKDMVQHTVHASGLLLGEGR